MGQKQLTDWHRSNHTIVQLLIVLFISSRSNIDQLPLDIILQRRDAFEGDLEDVCVFELCFRVEDFDALKVNDRHDAVVLRSRKKDAVTLEVSVDEQYAVVAIQQEYEK